MEQLAITGVICFVVGGVFGWFFRAKFKEIKDRVTPDLNLLIDRLKKELKEAKDELKKYKNK
jgi:hypothetical protein